MHVYPLKESGALGRLWIETVANECILGHGCNFTSALALEMSLVVPIRRWISSYPVYSPFPLHARKMLHLSLYPPYIRHIPYILLYPHLLRIYTISKQKMSIPSIYIYISQPPAPIGRPPLSPKGNVRNSVPRNVHVLCFSPNKRSFSGSIEVLTWFFSY